MAASRPSRSRAIRADFVAQGDAARAFDAYFVKPIDAPRFLRTVEATLAKPPGRDEIAI